MGGKGSGRPKKNLSNITTRGGGDNCVEVPSGSGEWILPTPVKGRKQQQPSSPSHNINSEDTRAMILPSRWIGEQDTNFVGVDDVVLASRQLLNLMDVDAELAEEERRAVEEMNLQARQNTGDREDEDYLEETGDEYEDEDEDEDEEGDEEEEEDEEGDEEEEEEGEEEEEEEPRKGNKVVGKPSVGKRPLTRHEAILRENRMLNPTVDREKAVVGHRDDTKLTISLRLRKKGGGGGLIDRKTRFQHGVDWDDPQSIRSLNRWRQQTFRRDLGKVRAARLAFLAEENRFLIDWHRALPNIRWRTLTIAFNQRFEGRRLASKPGEVRPKRTSSSLLSQRNRIPEIRQIRHEQGAMAQDEDIPEEEEDEDEDEDEPDPKEGSDKSKGGKNGKTARNKWHEDDDDSNFVVFFQREGRTTRADGLFEPMSQPTTGWLSKQGDAPLGGKDGEPKKKPSSGSFPGFVIKTPGGCFVIVPGLAAGWTWIPQTAWTKIEKKYTPPVDENNNPYKFTAYPISYCETGDKKRKRETDDDGENPIEETKAKTKQKKSEPKHKPKSKSNVPAGEKVLKKKREAREKALKEKREARETGSDPFVPDYPHLKNLVLQDDPTAGPFVLRPTQQRRTNETGASPLTSPDLKEFSKYKDDLTGVAARETRSKGKKT